MPDGNADGARDRAWIQLWLLSRLDAFLGRQIGQAVLAGTQALVRDLDDAPLFLRIPLTGSADVKGYVDAAVTPTFGSALLAAVTGSAWDETQIRARFEAAGWTLEAPGHFLLQRFPSVALRATGISEREALVDVDTLRPTDGGAAPDDDPTLILPLELRLSSQLEVRLESSRAINELLDPLVAQAHERLTGEPIWKVPLDSLPLDLPPELRLVVERLRYKDDNGHGHACFELRSQKKHAWCAAACVQMVLAFYRYDSRQNDLAQDLGLGELGSFGENQFKVVTTLAARSSDALAATMNASSRSFWLELKREIDLNRPVILFGNSHARVAAGYSILSWGRHALRALRLFDPEPKDGGRIDQWEVYDQANFDLAFSAQLDLPPPG